MRMKLISSPLSFWIGLRYLAAKRRNHFISFISASSMVGMTLGVAVLILVLSVMNGFDRELRERILGMVPHAVIYERGGIQNWQSLAAEIEQMPGVAGVALLLRLQGLLAYGGRVQGAMIAVLNLMLRSRFQYCLIILTRVTWTIYKPVATRCFWV